MKQPLLRATLATGCFSLVALFALFFYAPLSSVLLPHAIFLGVLLLNTFFSIRFFARIQPDDAEQRVIDILLALSYIALGLSLGRALPFAVIAFILFILASAKYVFMRGKTPHEKTIRRKLSLDIWGTFLCAAFLAGTLAGYPFAAAWLFALIFTGANIYLLWVKPMYRH